MKISCQNNGALYDSCQQTVYGEKSNLCAASESARKMHYGRRSVNLSKSAA